MSDFAFPFVTFDTFRFVLKKPSRGVGKDVFHTRVVSIPTPPVWEDTEKVWSVVMGTCAFLIVRRF